MSHWNTLTKKSWDIYFFAALFSIVLSIFVSAREVVINPDAICYLKSAETFVGEGLRAAMRLCDQSKWPFYYYIIAKFVQLTHLSYTTAAFVIDGFFSLMTVLLFIAVVGLLDNRRSVLWFAAAVILLAHEFNSTRQYIVRDHGFWAFYLLSIFFLIQYVRDLKWRAALGWGASMMMATLFRIEGAIFFLLIPLITLFDTRWVLRKRLQSFLKLNTVLMIAAAVVVVGFFIHAEKGMINFGRLPEIQYQIVHGAVDMVRGYHDRAEALKHSVLGMNAARDAFTVLLLVIIAMYLINIVGNISFIYAALVMYAWWKRLMRLPAGMHSVLWAYVMVNVLVTFIFFVENMFLSKRYLIALSLTLMLWAPFALDDLWRRFRLYFTVQKVYGLFLVVAAAMILTSLGGIFDFGHSKAYIRNAGDWLAVNVPENKKIYSNDYHVLYYSKHFEKDIFQKEAAYHDVNTIAKGSWRQFDYLALQFSKKQLSKDPLILREVNWQPIQVFENKRGDQVAIYKVKHN